MTAVVFGGQFYVKETAMKKYISAILALALAVCALTACEDKDSSSQADSSSVSESKSAESRIKDIISGDESLPENLQLSDEKTYCKEAFNYAAKYCTDKDEAGDTVTFSVWEFDPTRPDKDEEFEVFISEKLGDSAKKGYLSFHFDNGIVSSVEYKNKQGESVATYPEK